MADIKILFNNWHTCSLCQYKHFPSMALKNCIYLYSVFAIIALYWNGWKNSLHFTETIFRNLCSRNLLDNKYKWTACLAAKLCSNYVKTLKLNRVKLLIWLLLPKHIEEQLSTTYYILTSCVVIYNGQFYCLIVTDSVIYIW